MSMSLETDEAYARALQEAEYQDVNPNEGIELDVDVEDEHDPPHGSEFAVYLKSVLRDIPNEQMAQTVTVMKDAIKRFEDGGGKAEPLPDEALALLNNGPLKFTMSSMWRMMSLRRNSD